MHQNRVICLAELMDTPILLVHISGGPATKHIRDAQTRLLPIYGETCPQYMFLLADSMRKGDFEGNSSSTSILRLTNCVQARSAYVHLRFGRISPTKMPYGPGSRTEPSLSFLQTTPLPNTTILAESNLVCNTGTFRTGNSVSSQTVYLVSKPAFLFSSPVASSRGVFPHRNSSKSRPQTQPSYTD
jgi:hypothetical protein